MKVRKCGNMPILPIDAFEAAWARRDYVKYCTMVHHGAWVPGRMHMLIAKKLEAVARGEIKRIMFWIPPQHGKSMEITETFPSWHLGKFPDKRVMEASYNDSFAKKFGRKNRSKIREFGMRLFNIDISKVNSSAARWDIADHRGGMISIGFNGAATGEGADLLIVDDPVKNRKDANSKTKRDFVWDEYKSTLKTRTHPDCSIIIVMTRWHEDDLCGRLLNPEYGIPEDWEIVRLPAECEDENDLLGRNKGDPLWPEGGYDADWLKRQKESVGSYAWAGLYQQRPAPLEGGILKRGFFQFYEVAPSRFDQIVQSWDCAFKDGEDNDYVAGHVWGRKGADYYLLDRVHGKMGIVATMQAIESLSAKWPKAYAKYVEDKANGPAVIEMLQHKVPGLLPVNPQGGKVVRAQAVAPFLEAGNIYLPKAKNAPWVHDVMEECANFPNGANDDDVDAMTQAIINMGQGGKASPPPADMGTQDSYWTQEGR